MSIINISEIDPTLILNVSTDEYIGFSFIPLNDIIYMYPVAIIAGLGAILNLFCIIVYFKKEFNNPMFFYFKIISVCSFIQTLTAVPYGVCNAIRIIPDNQKKFCSYYLTSYVILGSLLIYYQSVLEIAILLDRLRTFNQTIKKYFTLSPGKLSIILFVICFIIDLFYMLTFVPQEFVWYNYRPDGTLERKSVWYLVLSTIAASDVGRILTILTYVIREFVTILFTVGFSLWLLFYMRAYFKNKAKMAKKPAASATSAQASSAQKSSNKQMNDAEEKFLQLVIVQCTLTIITRSNFFTCCLMALFNYNELTQIWCALADINIQITPASAFFIYFFFNKLFKKEFLKIFNIQVK